MGNVVARRAMLMELHRAAGHPGSRWRAAIARTVRLADAPEGDPSLTRFDGELAETGTYSPAMAGALASLTPRERGVVTMRILTGLTLDAVGRALGVTRERVRQIEARGLQKLRHELAPPRLCPTTLLAGRSAPQFGGLPQNY